MALSKKHGIERKRQREREREREVCGVGRSGRVGWWVIFYLENYTVVIINWAQFLVPPLPFSFPDSRDLPEVLGDFLGRERGGGP